MNEQKRISVLLTTEILSWIEKQIAVQRFASVSHGVRYILSDFIQKEEGIGKSHNSRVASGSASKRVPTPRDPAKASTLLSQYNKD